MAALIVGAVLLTAGAFAYDRWLDPDETPLATLLTAMATAAAVTFTASGAGHPGIRDLVGAALLGAIVGVPLAWVVGRAAQLVARAPASPRRREA